MLRDATISHSTSVLTSTCGNLIQTMESICDMAGKITHSPIMQVTLLQSVPLQRPALQFQFLLLTRRPRAQSCTPSSLPPFSLPVSVFHIFGAGPLASGPRIDLTMYTAPKSKIAFVLGPFVRHSRPLPKSQTPREKERRKVNKFQNISASSTSTRN